MDALKKHKRRIAVLSAVIILLAVVVLIMPTVSSYIAAPGPMRQLNIGRPSLTQSTVQFRVPSHDLLLDHIKKTLGYIYRNINPETHLAYSLPGDKRLRYWSVTYDNAMRVICHIKTGDLRMARKSMDYFLDSTAVQKVGWVYKNGRRVSRPGWNVNIVDAAEPRLGGRGIEHIAHTGPNAYLGIAAIHLYQATREQKYLDYARGRWALLRDLQNTDPDDFNYGGIRMGPLGDSANPREQRLNFRPDGPSFYQFYNGEHAADYKALCDLLARVDRPNRAAYQRAAHLIAVWDHRIYDKKNKLFFIGTTEVGYFDDNIGEWIEPGVVAIHPLDTSALKISAYGVKGMDQFEPGAAEKVRAAMDEHFLNTVETTLAGRQQKITGYDFVSHTMRKRLVLFEEQGPHGDIKVKKGVGRQPLLSDEWSTWVAFADLRLAKDFERRGDRTRAARYRRAYQWNALHEGLRTADTLDDFTAAYPYVHPITYGFNKPVGFGWNTHHDPYSMIGGIARILGILASDPFSLDSPSLIMNPVKKVAAIAPVVRESTRDALVTEAELYINEAWAHVRAAERRQSDEEHHWEQAAKVVERMFEEHPDWSEIAEAQNVLAQSSGDRFPLRGNAALNVADLEPVFRKYWALYHVGTGEFIRVMAYTELARIGKRHNDKKLQWDSEAKVRQAAHRITTKYYYAQAFDKSGWLWQPVFSLREYLGDSAAVDDIDI